jgi:hypothetical protein
VKKGEKGYTKKALREYMRRSDELRRFLEEIAELASEKQEPEKRNQP